MQLLCCDFINHILVDGNHKVIELTRIQDFVQNNLFTKVQKFLCLSWYMAKWIESPLYRYF